MLAQAQAARTNARRPYIHALRMTAQEATRVPGQPQALLLDMSAQALGQRRPWAAATTVVRPELTPVLASSLQRRDTAATAPARAAQTEQAAAVLVARAAIHAPTTA